MSDEVTIEVISDAFPEIAAALPGIVGQLVRKAAFDIQAWAAAAAPVDTGFLKSSIYVVTKDSSTYGQGVTNPPEGAEMLDEVSAPGSPTEAIVAVGASYGVYVEFGTVFMNAQPYLTPAAEAVRPMFIASLETLERYITALSTLADVVF